MATLSPFGEGRYGEGTYGGGLMGIQEILVGIGVKAHLLPVDRVLTNVDRKQDAACVMLGILLLAFVLFSRLLERCISHRETR